MKRRFATGESSSKRLPGRPSKKTKKEGSKFVGRCLGVQDQEKVASSRTHTAGVFASVNMAPASAKGGNEILNIVEMLDGESHFIRREAIKDLRSSKIWVGVYCHDCACRVKKEFEGKYCKQCLLDGFHGDKHKCGLKSVKHTPQRNSQAAEQLWAKLDKYAGFVTEMTRPHFRYFLREWAVWRNQYARNAKFRSDTTPLASRRRLQKHGRR